MSIANDRHSIIQLWFHVSSSPLSVFVFWLDGAWCKCRVRRTYFRLLSLVSHYWHYIRFMQLSLDIQIPNLLFVKCEPLSYSMSKLWWQFWCNLPWQHKISKENSHWLLCDQIILRINKSLLSMTYESMKTNFRSLNKSALLICPKSL